MSSVYDGAPTQDHWWSYINKLENLAHAVDEVLCTEDLAQALKSLKEEHVWQARWMDDLEVHDEQDSS